MNFKSLIINAMNGIESVYDGNILLYVIPYQNGQKHGIETGYYFNGVVEYTITWKNGIRHGFVNGYYFDGSIRRIYKFIDGVVHGHDIEYYKNGNINTITIWNGIFPCKIFAFNIDGSPRNEAEYIYNDEVEEHKEEI